MIKLIAMDVDGTLINLNESWIKDEVLEQAERLMDLGVIVCFATGRQFANLLVLAKHLKDRFYYLAENGAAIFGPGPEHSLLYKKEIDRSAALHAADLILNRPECELVICGANMFYILPKTKAFEERMSRYQGCNLTVVSSYDEIHEPIVKVSGYSKDSEALRCYLAQNCDPALRCAISGPVWVDVNLADKGMAIRELCRQLDISLEDVAAFGDNYNDMQILNVVGHPYIRNTAAAELQERYGNVFSNVEDVLRTFR